MGYGYTQPLEVALRSRVVSRDPVAVNVGAPDAVDAGIAIDTIVIHGCNNAVLVGIAIVDTGIPALILERMIVAAVEEVDEAGDAGFGVIGEVDDAFLGFLASCLSDEAG